MQRSEDGGKTFSAPVRVNDKEGDVTFMSNMPPQVKVKPGGQVYVLWTKTDFSPELEAKGFGAFGFSSMRFASSVDGGKSFSAAAYVEKDEVNSQIFPAFDVSPDDKVYVGWISQSGSGTAGGASVKLASSADGGRTFTPSVKVDEPANPCSNVDVAAGSKAVYVSFRKVLEVQVGSLADPFAKAVKDIVVARSDDGGRTFKGSQKVADDKFLTNLCIDAGGRLALDREGRLHIAWYTGKEGAPGIYYATSADGQTFDKPVPVYTSEWVPATMVGMASDEDNNTWITWELAGAGSGHTQAPEKKHDQDDVTAIQVTVVGSDGKIVTSQMGDSAGRRPVIAAGNGNVVLGWNSHQGVQVGVLSNVA
ncbi:MAG: sialidase family protein [Nitrososphaera sp.]